MERYIELEQIILLPAEINPGYVPEKMNIIVDDKYDKTFTKSYPIFTAPTKAIVGEDNVKVFTDNGIKPILSREENINTRLNLCRYVFCAFSMAEIQQYFLRGANSLRGGQDQYRICMETGNGHSEKYLGLCSELKRIYGPQVIVMGGNIGCPETYNDYAKSGFDYVRVGIANRSSDDRTRYGIGCPMGSMLDNLRQFRKSASVGLPRQTKVIADGGITCMSDIVKALALGADYVMIGKEFARCIEAEEVVYKKDKSGKLVEVKLEDLVKYDSLRAKLDGLVRHYYAEPGLEKAEIGGNSINNKEENWTAVKVDTTLRDWVDEFKTCALYNLTMAGATNWEEFRIRVRYGSIG